MYYSQIKGIGIQIGLEKPVNYIFNKFDLSKVIRFFVGVKPLSI